MSDLSTMRYLSRCYECAFCTESVADEKHPTRGLAELVTQHTDEVSGDEGYLTHAYGHKDCIDESIAEALRTPARTPRPTS